MEIKLNKVFKEFNRTKKRYRVAKGSAGSGKSKDVAIDYILKLSDSKYKGANLLVVRQTEASHKDSTFAELVQAINDLGLSSWWDYTTTPLSLTSISLTPESISLIVISLLFASIEFSTNSLTTLAGLSTTSPAAIIFASTSSKHLMTDIKNHLHFNYIINEKAFP